MCKREGNTGLHSLKFHNGVSELSRVCAGLPEDLGWLETHVLHQIVQPTIIVRKYYEFTLNFCHVLSVNTYGHTQREDIRLRTSCWV